MKKEIKKFVAITLCFLGALTSSPLVFCSGTTKKDLVTKPAVKDLTTKPIPLVKKILLINAGKLHYLTDTNNITAMQYCQANQELNGVVQALYAKPMVEEKAFLNQTKMQALYLPKIKTISRYAFEGCKNLKALILTSSIEYIHPEAFKGCDPKLKIICDDICYTIPNFFTKMFEKIKKQYSPLRP